MDFTVFKLQFPQGIHIGDGKPDTYTSTSSFLRSDTMYAAITAMLAQLGDLPEGYVPSYTISSLFPYTSIDNEVEYFFPRPITKLPFPETSELIDFRKKIKKLQWIGKDYFERVLMGNSFSIDEIKQGLQGAYFSERLRVFKGMDQRIISTTELRDRVKVPRQGGEDATPFSFEVMRFEEGSGLYFLCSTDGKEDVIKALELLKDTGLGTDKNLGYGHFSYTEDRISIQVPERDCQYAVSLGLITPSDISEWKSWIHDGHNNYSAYSLIKRGGWITTEGFTSFKKGSIYMLKEGSIIQNKQNHEVAGNAFIDLSPISMGWKDMPPVLRCGKSFTLPINIPTDV